MHFELPVEEQNELEPMHEEVDHLGKEWKVPLDQLEQLVEGDQALEEMLEDVLDQCLRYTKSVVEEQRSLNTDGRGEEYEKWDEMRSITHTATQDTLRAFSRNLVKTGKEASAAFKILPNTESRASCGKFALLLTLSR